MKFAVLAAGEGSRLVEEGVAVPKPLVSINGQPMIDRLMGIFMRAGAEEIVVITNDLYPEIQAHIRKRIHEGWPIRLVVKTTPSSMHSFYELMPLIGTGKFCLTTVDTIFREPEFLDYIEMFKRSEDDGLMAATDFVDDEKPLYISTDPDNGITGFHDTLEQFRLFKENQSPQSVCNLISGGIYCLDHRAFPTLERCINNGMARMRNFQRQLVADGLRLKAYKFTKILDVDHADDIIKAEDFLNE